MPKGRAQLPAAGALVLLVEDRYRTQRQPAGLLAALARCEVPVAVVDPGVLVHRLEGRPWVGGASVIVARGRSAPLLSALVIAERFGVPTVNRSAAVAAVRDKAAMAAALVAARLPTPPTWFGPRAELAGCIPSGAYPLVLKPVFGDNGRDVRLVTTPHELATLPWPETMGVAQSFVPGDGADLKVYAIADRLWAVRAPSPLGVHATATPENPSPTPLTPELASMTRACGALFGLELFGVDFLVTPDGPVVVEVNDFPNYRSVPEADEALAQHVLRARSRR